MSQKDSTTEEGWWTWDPEQQEAVWNPGPIPDKVRSLRRALYRKAKQEPEFRFYALYDRIYRKDVLMEAWKRVHANGGAPGIDDVTIDQIACVEDGPQQLVEELHEELREKRYKPQPVRRVYIPKGNGEQRPLGIPTVRDRVVQMAAVLVLEPIFEADFEECSFGFRPQRCAHQALKAIRTQLESGKLEVYDADLAGYFDSIPHDKLIEAVHRRVVDRSVLKLLEMWLTAPVVEPGPGQRSSWRPTQGTPQGGVISPLLANVYLHQFDAAFHGDTGPAHWANARMVRYADDFVVLARYVGKRLQDWIASELEGQLKLKIHEGKTQIVDMRQPGASFDFLGYTFRYDDDRHGRAKKYLNMFPSKKSLAKERQALRQMTDPRYCFMPIPAIIRRLNRHLKGWSNYFGRGYPRKAFREINHFVRQRLTRHLKRRSQRPYHPPKGKSFYAHFRDLGLEYL